jgi:hypothetical protein
MYLEFIILIFDYFRTLRTRYVLFEWLVPVIISYFVYLQVGNENIKAISSKFSDTTVTLLGVLIGFSITVITIFQTSSSKNIEEIKSIPTEFKIGKQKLFLFHLVLINLTYLVVVEVFSLLINLTIPFIWHDFSDRTVKIILSLNIFFISHILLMNIRNITDFYFILFKQSKN